MIGRFLAVLNVIAMPAISIWKFNTLTAPLAFYTGFIAILVGIIEVPLLCSCMKACVVIAKYTKRISGYWWIRGTILTLIAAGGFAIYQLKSPEIDADGDSKMGYIYMLLCHVSLVVSSFFYFVATFRKEDNPSGTEADKAAVKEAASGFGGFFGRAAVKAAKENPQATAGVAAAIAPSMGQQLFGGFGGSSSTTASSSSKSGPKGFYDDDEESNSGGYSAPQVPLGGSTSATSSSSPSTNTSKGFFGGFGGFGGSSSSGNSKTSSSPTAPSTSSYASAPASNLSDFQPAPTSSKGFYDEDGPESNPFLS